MIITDFVLNKNNINRINYKNNTFSYSYMEKTEPVETTNYVHPLLPEGHLIHDNLSSSIKYFFKDIQYSLKSLKNGINGSANDHQLGKLNDVGLVTAGGLIAAYLASLTTNKKVRIMEFLGLGAFLTSMSIYPKLAINLPAKIMHGFDIDKEFIDDQGRKKSVMQDSNYIPYDMYLGEFPSEDIGKIGDKMGIPKDIKNRNEVIKDQMRKISTQNNTMWMLTAGVTPALAGLLCFVMENYAVTPVLEKLSLVQNRNLLMKLLDKTSKMTLDYKEIKTGDLGKRVASCLSFYKNKELSKADFDLILEMLSKNQFANTQEGIKEDLLLLFKTSKGSKVFSINNEKIKGLYKEIKNVIFSRNRKMLEEAFLPSREELFSIFNKYCSTNADSFISAEDVVAIKKDLNELLLKKSSGNTEIPKKFGDLQRGKILECLESNILKEEAFFVTDEVIEKVVNFANIIEDFSANQKAISKIVSFNIEHTNNTLIANSYEKFQNTLLDVLDIKYKDLKRMKDSDFYTKEIFDKKLSELVKDENKFLKSIDRLAKCISDFEVKLNGENPTSSFLANLINEIEHNYNNTAKRLSALKGFENTIDSLVNEPVDTLSITKLSRQEIFDLLDGTSVNEYKHVFGWDWLTKEAKMEYLQFNSKGFGSSKNLEISRLIDRYQGAKNSYNRILHLFDVYKRALNQTGFSSVLKSQPDEYVTSIINMAKETLLVANSSDYTQKLHMVNNPTYFRDFMNSLYEGEGEFFQTKQKGKITDSTKGILKKYNSIENGNILDRFQYYLARFRNIIGNNEIDFTKPHHLLNSQIKYEYSPNARTRLSMFNLIGQSPVEMLKNIARQRYSSQSWLRIIGGITGAVFGLAFISQLFFGKLTNSSNLKKQVNLYADNK